VKRYAVVWRPAARADLIALYDWIAVRAEPDIAFAYSSRIEAHAANLAEFPERGTPRDDLEPGLRTTPYTRRTIIAYRVSGDEVEILRLVHAGEEWGEGRKEKG
jgi:toxin ParE1/3/4